MLAANISASEAKKRRKKKGGEGEKEGGVGFTKKNNCTLSLVGGSIEELRVCSFEIHPIGSSDRPFAPFQIQFNY